MYLRFEDRGGRLTPVDLFLADDSDRAITANLLRRLPLGRIEAMAQSNQDAIRRGLLEPGPDLRRAAAYYSAGSWVVDHPRRPDHWVARMFYAQIPGSGEAQAPMPRRLRPPRPSSPPDPTLKVPAARPYGDAFYRHVAEVYSALARELRSPAGAMADANGVPVTTIHRWVKQARARGYLPPGHPGKAG